MRDQILTFVRANPGAHSEKIARELGTSHVTLRKHVRELLNEGALREEPKGTMKLLFASGDGESTTAHREPQEAGGSGKDDGSGSDEQEDDDADEETITLD